jgi:acyl-CoA thioesterase II
MPAARLSTADVRAALELEQVDAFLFRADQKSLWRPPGSRAVYGGQVYGLALLAAHESLGNPSASPEEQAKSREELPLHSAHGYFLLPGDASKPIIFT